MAASETDTSPSKERQLAVVGIVASVVLAGAVAFAGADTTDPVSGLSPVAWATIAAFIINWAALVPAYLRQTERFYDIVGTATYLTILSIALIWGPRTPRALLLGVLVSVWALRLGLFLLTRIRQDGSDGRFDAIKVDPLRFASTWSLQALWCVMTVSCALAAMLSNDNGEIGVVEVVGAGIWLAGWSIEALADHQKRAFRRDPANRGRFITTGLWAWSRHPNYFGEIVLWVGIAVIAVRALDGFQYVTLISPVFVYVLLTRVSGVPLLEARAHKRWGDEPVYRDYVAATPTLVLRPPRPAPPAAQ